MMPMGIWDQGSTPVHTSKHSWVPNPKFLAQQAMALGAGNPAKFVKEFYEQLDLPIPGCFCIHEVRELCHLSGG
jgi:hypothetical protein